MPPNSALLAQVQRRAFVDQVAAGQLARAHVGVGKQRAAAAFDVDPAVHARGAGVGRDGVQLFLALAQVLGQRLQPRGALLEIQRQQARQAHAAGVVHRLAKVERFSMGVGHGLAIDGAAQGLGRLRADPAAADETLEKSGHVWGWGGSRKQALGGISRPIGHELSCILTAAFCDSDPPLPAIQSWSTAPALRSHAATPAPFKVRQARHRLRPAG